jgi:hypothetical protein
MNIVNFLPMLIYWLLQPLMLSLAVYYNSSLRIAIHPKRVNESLNYGLGFWFMLGLVCSLL